MIIFCTQLLHWGTTYHSSRVPIIPEGEVKEIVSNCAPAETSSSFHRYVNRRRRPVSPSQLINWNMSRCGTEVLQLPGESNYLLSDTFLGIELVPVALLHVQVLLLQTQLQLSP